MKIVVIIFGLFILGATMKGIFYLEKLISYNSRIGSIRNNYKNVITIDFDKFIKFYRINPKKYDFSRINIKLEEFPEFILYNPDLNIDNFDSNKYRLIFPKYREYKKFLKFYENLKKEMSKNISEENMVGYLTDVQKDINRIKEQVTLYINKSLDIIKGNKYE